MIRVFIYITNDNKLKVRSLSFDFYSNLKDVYFDLNLFLINIFVLLYTNIVVSKKFIFDIIIEGF